jgi:hypothetical protein
MSSNESEKVGHMENAPSDSDVSSSSDLPDTPPPSRSGSDASSDSSSLTTFSESATTTNEFEASSMSQSTTLCNPLTCKESDSDVSDQDQCPYEKELQWKHLDKVPSESLDDVNSTHAETSSTQSSNDLQQSSDDNHEQNEEDVCVDEEDVCVDEEDVCVDEDEEDCQADDEKSEDESDSDVCSERHYVYLVPNHTQTEYPPLLTFLFFLFLFLHLVHYMLLVKDSHTNHCFPFRN